MQTEIKEIQRRVGVSILFVTHDREEAMMMSDRSAVMADGEIAQIGSPSELYLHPRIAFVAGVLGETDLLPVTMHAYESTTALVRYQNGMLGHVQLPRSGRVPKRGELALVSRRPERLCVLGAEDAADQEFTGTVRAQLSWAPRPLGRAGAGTEPDDQRHRVARDDLRRARRTVRLGWSPGDAQLLANTRPSTATGAPHAGPRE